MIEAYYTVELDGTCEVFIYNRLTPIKFKNAKAMDDWAEENHILLMG